MGENFKGKYGSPLEGKMGSNVSKTWRGIIHAVDILRTGMESSHFLHDDMESEQRCVTWQGKDPKCFSVHSAYDLQFPGLEASEVRSHWSRLWGMKGPSRSNLFLWRLHHDGIPTQSMLFRRHIISTMYCDECGRMDLGPLHEIRDCPWAIKVWKVVVPQVKWRNFVQSSLPACWVEENVSHTWRLDDSVIEWRYLFREIAFGIWQYRLKGIHTETRGVLPPWLFVQAMKQQIIVMLKACCLGVVSCYM